MFRQGLFGGKGINVAKAIKTLGEEVRRRRCPRNNQAQFFPVSSRNRNRDHFISVPGTTRINVTLVETKVGQSTISTARAGIPSSVENEVMHYFESNVASGEHVLIVWKHSTGNGDDAYKKLIKICKEKGAIVLLDTHGDALKWSSGQAPYGQTHT